MRRWLMLAALLIAMGAAIPARALDMEFSCSEIRGGVLMPPTWHVSQDAYRGQTVTLTSRPDSGSGQIAWSTGKSYPGIAVAVTGGFVIIAVGPDWTEVYHVNVGNLELMMTATRGGSSVFPNSAKAFHGSCRPGRS